MIVHDPDSALIQYDNNRIILKLNNIRELLIAPDFDPFSKKETEFMGQSAISRIIRHLKPGWSHRNRDMRLTIVLPPDQITPGLADEVQGAIRRYCRVKLEDNEMQLRNIRWSGIRQIPFGFAFLAVCITLGTIFGQISTSWGSVLNEGFYIIGWVALWGPTDTLLFDPLPIKRENKILKIMMNIPLVIQPG
jgi:hypothetical protein